MANKKNSSNKGRTKVPRNKRYNKGKVSKDVETTSTYPNDPIWYGETPALIRDTASLSYGYPVGRPIDTGNILDTGTYGVGQFISMPGIWCFNWEPAVGISRDGASTLNIAARNLYSFVRHANSGHSNYDAPDLMLYMLAMDSLYYAYAWGCEIYGLARQYNHVNRYWPIGIMESMSLDVASFTSDLANFRYYLDVWAKKIGSLCVPNSLPYFKRHAQMSSAVYSDAPVLKAQLYCFRPRIMWKYDEYNGAGRLINVPLYATGGFTLQDYITAMDSCLNAVITSEDCNIMSGDILKAFGAESIVKLNLVPIEFETPIIYSAEMLSQIQNLSIITAGNTGVTQNAATGELLFSLDSAVNHSLSDSKKILTMIKEDVSPEETMVATRLSVLPHSAAGTGMIIDAVGSEYIYDSTLVMFAPTGGFAKHTIGKFGINTDFTNPTTCAHTLSLLTAIEKFGQHPMIYITEAGGGQTGPEEIIARLQDIDNFTIIENEELREMHEAALLSQFNVPQMGLWAAKTTN